MCGRLYAKIGPKIADNAYDNAQITIPNIINAIQTTLVPSIVNSDTNAHEKNAPNIPPPCICPVLLANAIKLSIVSVNICVPDVFNCFI